MQVWTGLSWVRDGSGECVGFHENSDSGRLIDNNQR